MWELRISCSIGEKSGDVCVRFDNVEGRDIAGVIQVQCLETRLDLTFPCYFLGYDVAEFLQKLDRINRDYAGTATLLSSNEEAEIRFDVANRGKGIVLLSGRLWAPYITGSLFPGEPTNWVKPRYEFRFQAFEIDQSDIPDLMRQLASFLNTSGVSTKSPWSE